MESATKSLWPDFGEVKELSPVAIMKAQAAELGEKTNHLVEGVVRTTSQVSMLHHEFILVAPALDNYSFGLFSVLHRIPMYPLQIVGFKLPDHPDFKGEHGGPELRSEAAFLKALEAIFNDPKTIDIIKSMIAASQ